MEHYYSKKPTSELKPRTLSFVFRGNSYEFKTGSGVFSPKKIDLGTQVLLKYAEVNEGDELLDLGCGYGVVGIVFSDIAKVTMTDINERAVSMAKENAKKNSANLTVVSGDGFESIDKKFNVILLNPPQTAGKKLCFRLIEESKDYLKKEGSLQIVARHQKGGKQLEKHMEETFGNVEILGKKSGFRVYKSTK